MLNINNRRYLGNKYKLLSFIKQIVDDECKNINSVFDAFAGTGSVSYIFSDKTLYINDILYSNHLAHITWFSSENIDIKKIEYLIKKYNNLKCIDEENYMSINFSNTYFSEEICKKIGYIRNDIEYNLNLLNKHEYAIMITSLIYAVDKIANTCGHYDSYRKVNNYNNNLIMEIPRLINYISHKNKFFNTDANKLSKLINCDLVYLDPPYNSRQYSDAYHLLENIARWEMKDVFGIAKKMDRTELKSVYCTKNATNAFEELVDNLSCKYILLSYNNSGNNFNDRSNAKINDSDIIRILSKKGELKVFSKPYKCFTTGKSLNTNNEERLFLCKINNKFFSSPLNYTGSKYKLISQIKPLFPIYIDKFVDLFCGGCNVGININANEHYYNDISYHIIELYKIFISLDEYELIQDIDNIISKYNLSNTMYNGYNVYGCNSYNGLSNYNREKFNRLKFDFNNLIKKDKYYYELFFVLIIFSFNNQIRFNSGGNYNLPVGKRDFNIKIRQKLIDFIKILKKQNPTFTSVSFKNFDISVLNSKSLVYCDPPYLITKAPYNENNKWTENNEIYLLEFLNNLNFIGIKFALSNLLQHRGVENTILLNWIKKNKYNIHFLDYNYNNSSYNIKYKKSISTEVLITNYYI